MCRKYTHCFPVSQFLILVVYTVGCTVYTVHTEYCTIFSIKASVVLRVHASDFKDPMLSDLCLLLCCTSRVYFMAKRCQKNRKKGLKSHSSLKLNFLLDLVLKNVYFEP